MVKIVKWKYELWYKVALFAVSTTNANKIIQGYMAQGLENMDCEEIKKTSFIDVI